ncbi:MAG TPA: hypothetical protein VGN72_07000 [Tepidisphaeraceae bacterium]|nr:hypothetical protein [Tepidisphaeraceae bacterium]
MLRITSDIDEPYTATADDELVTPARRPIDAYPPDSDDEPQIEHLIDVARGAALRTDK